MVIRGENIGGGYYRLVKKGDVLIFAENERNEFLKIITKLSISELQLYGGIGGAHEQLVSDITHMSSINFLKLCTIIRLFPTLSIGFQEEIRKIFNKNIAE